MSAIWMHLDRFIYSSMWESLFKLFMQHMSKITSDHCLLLVTCDLLSAHLIPKHFVFLNVWIKLDDFMRVVKESWDKEKEYLVEQVTKL